MLKPITLEIPQHEFNAILLAIDDFIVQSHFRWKGNNYVARMESFLISNIRTQLIKKESSCLLKREITFQIKLDPVEIDVLYDALKEDPESYSTTYSQLLKHYKFPKNKEPRLMS